MQSLVPQAQPLEFATVPSVMVQDGTVAQRSLDAVQYKPLPPEKQTHLSLDEHVPVFAVVV